MAAKNKVKNEDPAAESPTSVLEDEDVCDKEVEVKSEEEVVADDGSSLLPKSMAEEEEKLLKARAKEEEEQCEEAPDLNDTQFNKLDELLTQTKLYSEFLLEKMDDITLTAGEQENQDEEESKSGAKKKGRGKRKAASQCNTVKSFRRMWRQLPKSL